MPPSREIKIMYMCVCACVLRGGKGLAPQQVAGLMPSCRVLLSVLAGARQLLQVCNSYFIFLKARHCVLACCFLVVAYNNVCWLHNTMFCQLPLETIWKQSDFCFVCLGGDWDVLLVLYPWLGHYVLYLSYEFTFYF